MNDVLVKSNDPILKQVMEPYKFEDYNATWDLAEHLVKVMREKKGLGLSANQLGLPYRVFAMEGDPAMVCFNPRVVDVSSETITLEEGCLSFPNLYLRVKRPRTIRVRFTDPSNETHTQKLDGISARVFLHEMDHLDGIDYRKRANRYHLEKAQKQKHKLDKGLLQADPSKLIQTLKMASTNV